jgi:regulator of sigma E protease
MSIIIFIIILIVLILVHEIGHFVVAKRFGVRVDEFGLGYPPRVLRLFKKGETEYTLNAIPFGGFVKIFGENPDEESTTGADSRRSLVNKPKYIQALVLVAGVFFNFLFAWLLISIGFMSGLPTPLDYAPGVSDAKVVITNVSKNSPAEQAGLKVGDTILNIKSGDQTVEKVDPKSVSSFISSHDNITLDVSYGENGNVSKINLVPKEGIAPGKKAIGVSMDMIGILKLPVHKALWEGIKTTLSLTKQIFIGLAGFLYKTVTGHSNLSEVTGPVGIVGMVGGITQLGFIYLLSFTAFISINLAVINLIPFPALDGGRLLFVVIEAIKGSRINPKIANAMNAVGFLLLILLMVVVTFNDILRLL